MAQYAVEHSCSHTLYYDIGGRAKDRDWRITRMTQRPCPECYFGARRAASEAAGKAAIEAVDAAAVVLPSLRGSQRQIEWATQIRARAVVAASESREMALRFDGVGAACGAALAIIEDAAWFCDRGRRQPHSTALAALGWLIVRDTPRGVGEIAAALAPAAAREIVVEYERDGAEAFRRDRASGRVLRTVGHVIGDSVGEWWETRGVGRERAQQPDLTVVASDTYAAAVFEVSRELAAQGIEEVLYASAQPALAGATQ